MILNDELERMRKEAVLTFLIIPYQHLPEELKGTAKPSFTIIVLRIRNRTCDVPNAKQQC